jgi:transcriptional regulator
VGFHMVVEEVGNVFKLSQNRDEPSFHNIMDELNARDGDAREIASHMQRIKNELYKK